MEEESEAVQPREARGTTPIADFAKLSVSMPERREVTTPLVLPPMPEQAVPADVEMVAEEPGEGDVLGEAQLMFGRKEKDLTQGEWAELKEWRKQWSC